MSTELYRHIPETVHNDSCITGRQASGLLLRQAPIGDLHAAFCHAWAL